MKTKQNYYIVYKYNKKTKAIESKTFSNFDKSIHNSNKQDYYYFNFNLENGLLENPYSNLRNDEINKICRKVNNYRIMQEVFALCKNEVYLIDNIAKKYIRESENIYKAKQEEIKKRFEYNKKQLIKERYEQNKTKITERLSERFKVTGEISSVI